ncbi:hypothetical protein C0J52_01243 [Blattella germanica]|nr:hypothetical protein C0J52_01243 [Blattella germanica]
MKDAVYLATEHVLAAENQVLRFLAGQILSCCSNRVSIGKCPGCTTEWCWNCQDDGLQEMLEGWENG